MAHRIYSLDPSYWRLSGGALTTSGLFAYDTESYVVNPATLTANGLSKSSSLTFSQMQTFRKFLGDGFTLPGGGDYQLSKWQAANFGSTLTDVQDNYEVFIQEQINNIKQLNPGDYDFSTLLISGTIGGTSYFIPIMVYSSYGVSRALRLGAGITFTNIDLTTLTVQWGAAIDLIPQAVLRYKLVRAESAGLLNTFDNAEANGTVVMDWTPNTTSYVDSGLLANTSYAYAVLVKDNFDNNALYLAQSQSTLADLTAPIVGTAIQFSNVTTDSMSLSWGLATDNYTAQASLQYKVVYSTLDNINSVTDAEENGTVAMDWTTNANSYTVTGLIEETTYYFAVIVKDAAENKALYPAQVQATTADSIAPTVGTPIEYSNLTAHSVHLSWGAATDNYNAQSALQYRLVYSTSNNIGSVANALANGIVAMDWTANATMYNVVGLADSTNYYFAVLVQDAHFNKSLYSPISFQTVDATAPIIGTAIHASNITASSIDLSWGAATDNLTSASELQYKVVSSKFNNIGSVTNALNNGSTVMDWTANALSYTATGLSSGTTFYFAVLVKDATGNTSLYPPIISATTDVLAPIIGSDIRIANITSSSMDLSWDAATDDATPQLLLQYKVVYSTSDNIGTVSDANDNGSVAMDWTTNATSYTVSGLAANSPYYFAVLVKDQSNNTALYDPVTETTAVDTTAPTIGTGITISIISLDPFSLGAFLNISWGAATDSNTAQAALEYKLVSSNADNIGTIEDAEANGTLLLDWTANETAYYSFLATQGTTSYFNVLVRDEAGNTSIYETASQAIPDGSFPLSSGDGIPVFSNITSQSVDVSWDIAIDALTPQENLEYKLVSSTSDNIGSILDINANGTIVMDWTLNTLTYSATGLAPSTTYYFNVLVRDTSGNVNVYASNSTETLADAAAPVPGNSGILTLVANQGNVSVEWTAATDDITIQSNLAYLVAKDSSDLYLSDYNDLITNHSELIVQNWTNGITSYYDTAVNVGDTPYYIVYVKDEAGNVAGYTAQGTTVPDQQAPQFAGAISFTNITYDSFDLSWDAATDNYDPSPMYKVYQSSTNNIQTVSDAEANGTVIMDWSSQLTTTASSLAYNTLYNFAVIAKDSSGNKEILTGSQATLVDTTAPVLADPSVVTSNITTTSIDLSWNAATDDYSSQENLQYKAVYSPSDNLTNVIDAEANGTISLDWTAATYTCTASDLSSNTPYYFAVLVKDEAGNKTLYSNVSDTTAQAADTTAPVPGNTGLISILSFTNNQVGIHYDEATDDVSQQAALLYKLVYSTSDNISTVSDAETNGTVAEDWFQASAHADAGGITNYITSLNAGTLYYFNVIVKDEADNKAIYTTNSQTTDFKDLSFGNYTDQTVELQWAANPDPAFDSYQVYYSTSDNINTVADAETNGTAFGDYSQTVGSTVTGLTPYTLYYFNVIAKDAQDNKVAYYTNSLQTLDLTSPVPGNSGEVLAEAGLNNSITVSWTAATDNVNSAFELYYEVYTSNANNISTVTDAQTNGTLVNSFYGDLNSNIQTNIGPFDPNTLVYVNIVVYDASSNSAAYNTVEFTTPA